MKKKQIQEMTDKIQRMAFEEAEKQIFEWVRSEKLTFKQFKKMNEANRNSTF